MIIRETEELPDNCSLTSLDGYSTIDQRDKDCKYKTGDGSVDLTEREPLKVWTELFWSPGGQRDNDASLKYHHVLFVSLSLFVFNGGPH